MRYNIDHLNIRYALVKSFLFNAKEYILDISYSRIGQRIELQIVLLEGYSLSQHMKEKVKNSLPEFDLNIKELLVTKMQFNENIGDWAPKYYDWLDEVIFSKAEVL